MQSVLWLSIIPKFPSINETRLEEKSIETLINDLIQLSGREVSIDDFKNLVSSDSINQNELKSWLNRLNYMSDFRRGGDHRKELAKKILDYLSSAETNQDFRKIEVFLGYPIKLKEKLNIPIAIETMLYFNCSTITDEGLKIATEIVEGFLNNEEEKISFLAKNEIWVNALKEKYPNEIDRLEQEKFAEETDFLEAEKKYENGIKRLTKDFF